MCAHAANDKYDNNSRPYSQQENPVSTMCSLTECLWKGQNSSVSSFRAIKYIDF